jgi:hypothetical protein
MSTSSRTADRDLLTAELGNTEFQGALEQLQLKEAFLEQFDTWAEVIAFMREGTSEDPEKDDVLRPIFRAHTEDQSPLWCTILLVIFWPGLESILFQKRRWDADEDERWQNIMMTFLEVICRIDVEKRPERLVQKVFNDTVHRLHDVYQDAWLTQSMEVATSEEDLEELAGGVEGIDFEAIDFRERQENAIESLRAHAKAGRINKSDLQKCVPVPGRLPPFGLLEAKPKESR